MGRGEQPLTGSRIAAGSSGRARVVLPAVALGSALLGLVVGLFLCSVPPDAVQPSAKAREDESATLAADRDRLSRLVVLRTRQLESRRDMEAKWDALRTKEDELHRASLELSLLTDHEARRAETAERTAAARKAAAEKTVGELNAALFQATATEREFIQAQIAFTRGTGTVLGREISGLDAAARIDLLQNLISEASLRGLGSRVRAFTGMLASEYGAIEAEREAKAPGDPRREEAERRVAGLTQPVEAARIALDDARAQVRAVENDIAALGEKP